MLVKVVDASAAGALLFGEPDAPQIVARLQDGQLVAPPLLQYEVMNICVKKLRRHPAQDRNLRSALGLFSRMAVRFVDVDIHTVVQLAGITGLTAYDASYLWLARKLNAELVTLDKALNLAATSAG